MQDGAIGPLQVRLSGRDTPLRRVLAEEIGPPLLQARSTRGHDLLIRVVNARDGIIDAYRPSFFSARTEFSFDEHAYRAVRPVVHVVSGLFDDGEQTVLSLVAGTEAAPVAARRLLGRAIGMHAAASYELLWSVVHAALLKRGASMIHAASLEIGGRRSIISGTGGSGKTSILLSLLRQPESAYLSEDFGIVDETGVVFPSPKSMTLFASDLEVLRWRLNRVSSDWSRADRARWTIHRLLGRNPLVRVRADRVGLAVGAAGPIDEAIYLRRSAGSSIDVIEITPSDFARRATTVVFREVAALEQVARLIAANAPDTWSDTSPELLVARTRVVIERAVGDASCHLVTVPAHATSEAILGALGHHRLLGQTA